jgi:hypothetical protein
MPLNLDDLCRIEDVEDFARKCARELRDEIRELWMEHIELQKELARLTAKTAKLNARLDEPRIVSSEPKGGAS